MRILAAKEGTIKEKKVVVNQVNKSSQPMKNNIDIYGSSIGMLSIELLLACIA